MLLTLHLLKPLSMQLGNGCMFLLERLQTPHQGIGNLELATLATMIMVRLVIID